MIHEVMQGNCTVLLDKLKDLNYFKGIHLTFLDPPFNQNKDYNHHKDDMPEEDYWNWMKQITEKIYNLTVEGGAIYFMQREKNAEFVLRTLRETGWQFQNLIIWQKLAGGVPSNIRFGKRYQIIAYFTKGKNPLTFNNLRYEPPLLAMHEYERETGMFLTDIWEDIRELTSGYFAGDEAIRTKNNEVFTQEGQRFHKQQSPIELLTRIILTSSKIGDFVLDPFAGTGVTAIVAKQLNRNSISIELDPANIEAIKKRLDMMRDADYIDRFYNNYLYSENLDAIWYGDNNPANLRADNYYFKEIPKSKLNDLYLMKETVKNILIHRLKIPENMLKFDYRFKDADNKIHRFELALQVKPKVNVIFRLIYAKNTNQADFWINRIKYEAKIIKEKELNSFYFAIISGIAFKNVINTLNNDFMDLLIAFSGWESIFQIPGIIEKFKLFKIFEEINKFKQISLDNF